MRSFHPLVTFAPPGVLALAGVRVHCFYTTEWYNELLEIEPTQTLLRRIIMFLPDDLNQKQWEKIGILAGVAAGLAWGAILLLLMSVTR